MPSNSSTSENGRHASPSRSKMEHILSRSLSKMERSLPPTPKMERSMSESIMLESTILQPQSPRTPEHSEPSSPPPSVEPFQPLSGLAHLSYVKNQRNLLRSELKSERIATAEAKASVAALRRLAFRLAVSISVKENRIANAARQLASSRKHDYVAEKKIQALQESLQEEERRSRDILQTLERASALAVQYATPSTKTPKRLQPSPMTPPSSPPIRVANLDYAHSVSKSPASHGLSGLWDHTGLPLVPDQSHSRATDDRLVKAKLDAEQALAACRNRIESLQSECLRSRENAKLLEVTHDGDIQEYEARITRLEKSKSEIEENLRSVQMQLKDSARSETDLRAELELKTRVIAELENGKSGYRKELEPLRKSKAQLEEKVRGCEATIRTLESRIPGLEKDVAAMRKQLSLANDKESDLLRQIAQHEEHRAHMDLMAEKRLKDVETLEKTVSVLDAQVKDYFEKLRSNEVEESLLRDGLQSSEQLRKQAESELASSRACLVQSEAKLKIAKDVIRSLQIDLECTRSSKKDLEQELREMGANFEHEFDLRRKTQLELDDLLASHKTLERSLEDAHARIAAVEQHGFDVEKELESLKKEKKFAEAQLKEVEQVSSTLRGDVGVHGEKVASLTSTIAKLREELAESRKSKAEIEDELKQTKTAHDSLQGKYRTTHDELESALESTSTLESSLDELRRSKAELEKLFQTALLRLKASEKRNTALRTDASEAQSIKHELEKSKTRNLQLQDELSNAEERNSALRHDVSEVQLMKDKLEKSNAQNLQLQQELSDAEKANAGLRSDAAEVNLMKDELEKSHLQNSQLREELSHAEKNKVELYAQVQATRKELAKLQTSITALEEQLKNANHSKAELEQELRDANVAREGAQERLNAGLRANADLASEFQTQINVHQDEVKVLTESIAKLKKDSDVSKSELQEKLSQMQEAKAKAEASLEETKNSNAGILSAQEAEIKAGKEEISRLQTVLNRLQSELEGAHMSESDIKRELESLRSSKSQLEEDLKEVSALNEKLRSELRHSEARLMQLEADNSGISTKLSETHEEMNSLRHTNADLERSAQRVTTVEQELDDVKHTNRRLTKFLERIESDMANAEAAVEDSERRLDEFMDESNTRFEAALESKRKYMRQLSMQGKEVAVLKEENSRLRVKLDQQAKDIDALKVGGNFKAVLADKDSEIAELRKSRAEFLASVRSIEDEVKTLRQDKETFDDIVNTLKAKTKQLELLSEWSRPHRQAPESSEAWASAQSHVDSHHDDVKSSSTSARGAEARSIHSRTSEPNRPPSRASIDPEDESLASWAKEVERVRMLRNETAVQLKNMKQSKIELKKTLKASEAQLHRLEKEKQQITPKKQRSVLHKRPPSTPNPPSSSSHPASTPLSSPQRPMTAGNPTTTPSKKQNQGQGSGATSPHRPWSSLPRPQTSSSPQRPHTSFGRLMSNSSRRTHQERRLSQVSDAGSEKSLRRFSSSVRRLFKQEKGERSADRENARRSLGP